MDSIYIACLGRQFDASAREVIDRISFRRSHEHCRFVLTDWLNGQVHDIHFLWIVDKSTPIEAVLPWLIQGIPALVPESSPELKELCVKFGAGLYYDSARDAEACLQALISDGPLHADLAANARLLVEEVSS